MQNKLLYNIKTVSIETGLNIHTIRAWEKRYSAITPERTETNRRMYTKADVDKLKFLTKAIEKGHSISNVANLSIEELKNMFSENQNYVQEAKTIAVESFDELIQKSIESISNYNLKSFESLLVDSSINLSRQNLLLSFIIPLLEKIGDLWENGSLRVTHEHFAVSILRTFLGSLLENNNNPVTSPKIITTTPKGFLHELGALIAALYSMDFGWNALFLGANLPAEEIAGAAKSNNAKAILLSTVYPTDDPTFGNQLRKLRRLVMPEFPILITGKSAKNYIEYINETSSLLVLQLDSLPQLLNKIRENHV